MMNHKEALDHAVVRSAMFPAPNDEDLTKFIRAYLDARGLVMVPKDDVTDSMIVAGIKRSVSWGRGEMGEPAEEVAIFKAMLAAAPDPFKDGE